MTTTRSHALPWTLRRFLACLLPQRRHNSGPILNGREAVAYNLYGESVQWSRLDMLNYDHSPYLQSFWLRVADRRIWAAQHSDRHIAAFHGHSIEAWEQFSTLAKVDMREAYAKAKGMAA
jgi:hypothetical protein